MTSKAYLVSWLGKSNIQWTPLEQSSNGFNMGADSTKKLNSAINFFKGNIETFSRLNSNLSSIQHTVTITQSMVAMTAGLQIVNLALTYKNYLVTKEIQRDVKEIKGKFEIHFLDQSIDYFIDNHKDLSGIIPSILYALEKDAFISLQELVENKSLVIPSYLEHKVYVITNSLRAWNEVVYATIHEGSIHKQSSEHIQKWVERTKNIANRSPDGGYVDQSIVLNEWAKFVRTHKEETSLFGTDKNLMEKAISKDNFDRCCPIINLAREIQYASDLYHSLEDKLTSQNEPFLLIKTS